MLRCATPAAGAPPTRSWPDSPALRGPCLTTIPVGQRNVMQPSARADVVIESDGVDIAMALPDKDSDHIQRFLAEQGRLYEEEMLEHASVFVEPGDLVIDVGAFIGTHTLFYALVCRARVVAFEPNPRSCAMLRANVE